MKPHASALLVSLALSLLACGGPSADPETGDQPDTRATAAPDEGTGPEKEEELTVDSEPDPALREGLTAVCSCPDEAGEGKPEEKAAALAACLKEKANDALADWVKELEGKSDKDKRLSLQALMVRANMNECALEAVWDE